jgi:hypothetical protein
MHRKQNPDQFHVRPFLPQSSAAQCKEITAHGWGIGTGTRHPCSIASANSIVSPGIGS